MKRLRNILITAVASTLLASCGLYTKYERPAQAVAGIDSLYRPEARPDTSRSLAALPWQELFTDPHLQSLIRQGLQANADLAVARLQVEEAQATLLQSKLAYLPSPCSWSRRAPYRVTTGNGRRRATASALPPRGR